MTNNSGHNHTFEHLLGDHVTVIDAVSAARKADGIVVELCARRNGNIYEVIHWVGDERRNAWFTAQELIPYAP